VARRTKRLWTDEEKRSICLQTTAPGVSVAQVARRYAVNANMVFKWLRDPRYAPETTAVAASPAFLPVEIIDRVRKDDLVVTSEPTRPQELIEVELAGGHRLRITGSYDPDALARLIRGLTA
jgi:transposase